MNVPLKSQKEKRNDHVTNRTFYTNNVYSRNYVPKGCFGNMVLLLFLFILYSLLTSRPKRRYDRLNPDFLFIPFTIVNKFKYNPCAVSPHFHIYNISQWNNSKHFTNGTTLQIVINRSKVIFESENSFSQNNFRNELL